MNSDSSPSLAQGRVQLDALTARIRAEFPALDFARAVLNDEGEDHAVAVLDGRWVFRFPRGAEAASHAAGERRLLARLADVARLAVPAYEFVSANGGFGGYRMIQGEPLGEARFAGLTRSAQSRVLDEIGDFLAALHGLPIAVLAGADGQTRFGHWSGAEQARAFAKRRQTLATALSPALLDRIDAFYAALPRAVDGATRDTLVHSDFSDDHILLSPGGDRLAGVIDFTDAGRGDPAFDFAFPWTYGDWAVQRVASRYGAADDLVPRSRWWFTRYRIDQIWWNLSGARAYDVARILTDLPRLFDALGV